MEKRTQSGQRKGMPIRFHLYRNWIGWADKKVDITLSENFIISNTHGFVVMLFYATSISD